LATHLKSYLDNLSIWTLSGLKPKPRDGAVKKINLALQGGGAHGAFTWACSTNCSQTDGWRSPASRAHPPAQSMR